MNRDVNNKVKITDMRSLHVFFKNKSKKKRNYEYGPQKFCHMLGINGNNVFLNRKSIKYIEDFLTYVAFNADVTGVQCEFKGNLTSLYGRDKATMKIYLSYDKITNHKDKNTRSLRNVHVDMISIQPVFARNPIQIRNVNGKAIKQ